MNNPWQELKGAPKTAGDKTTSDTKSTTIVESTSATQTKVSSPNFPPSNSQISGIQTPDLQSLPSAMPNVQNAETRAATAFSSDTGAPKTVSNRGGALLLLAIGAGIVIFDWYLRITQNVYYVKMALLGPIFLVLGALGLIFPALLDKNGDGSMSKPLRYGAYAIAFAAGGLNWYLLAN